jgi:hypothetical protein
MKKITLLVLSTILSIAITKTAIAQAITLDPSASSAADLLVKGDMALQKITRFTVNGGYTSVNRNGASVLIFEAGGSLNGIAGGTNGMLVYVLCGFPVSAATSTGALVLNHESTTETVAANRILTNTGSNFSITNGQGGVLLIYDGDKSRWRMLDVTQGASSFSGWGLTGNSGTNPASNYVGTTDAQPLVLKTNNVENVRVLSNGNVGLGTTTPTTKLDVSGDFALSKSTLIPLSVSTTINNLDRQGASRVYLSISVSAPSIILNGISGGQDGTILYLYTSSSTPSLTINDNNSSALANDRIFLPSSSPITITGRSGAIFIYEGIDLKWRLISLID